MASQIRKAAAWLGLVPEERYDEYGVDEAYDEYTEQFATESEPSTVTRLRPHQDEASDDDRAPEPRPREVVRSESVVQQVPAPRPSGATQARQVPRASAADLSRIVTVHPRTYNEARTIGEHFRDGVPVIMNVSDMDDADAKRLIDFAAGLTFGLRGTIEKVTNRVFLLSPPNVNVTAEDKERIASGGFFNQS